MPPLFRNCQGWLGNRLDPSLPFGCPVRRSFDASATMVEWDFHPHIALPRCTDLLHHSRSRRQPSPLAASAGAQSIVKVSQCGIAIAVICCAEMQASIFTWRAQGGKSAAATSVREEFAIDRMSKIHVNQFVTPQNFAAHQSIADNSNTFSGLETNCRYVSGYCDGSPKCRMLDVG